MSDIAVALPAASSASETARGIVCCPNDLCSQLPSAKLPWFRLVVGLFVASQTMILGLTVNLTAPDDHATLLLLQCGMLAATVLVIALLGLPLAMDAASSARKGRLSMELLFLLGISASLGISIWSVIQGTGPVYFEVVSILLVIYSLGRFITGHSRARALSAAQGMLNEVATARLADGKQIPTTQLLPGDRIRVVPGELIPADGLVIEGQSLVRTTAFNGEWNAGAKRPGDAVLAGTACEDGTLLIEATTAGSDRRIDRLAALIVSACQTNSPMQRLADRFVRVFLPLVALVAMATLLYWSVVRGWGIGVFNSLAVILVACPCAAGLATPLATWTAIARLANKGLLLRSADALQRLASVESVIFDKTGTLSDAALELKSLTTAPDPKQRGRTLAILAAVEKFSDHPVARVLRNLPNDNAACPPAVAAVRTLPGIGIEADIMLDSRPASVRLVRRDNADDLTIDATLDGTWIATATFSERLRESAGVAIERLRDLGIPVRIMTGDSSSAVANAATLAPTTGAMTPEAKHTAASAATTNVLFIGDGINDAAAMGASHCSIAMATGAAIAVETADATLHSSDLTLIPEAILLARKTIGTIRSSFAWAVTYNTIGMTVAAAGLLHPVFASVLMSLSSGVIAWRSLRLAGTGLSKHVGKRVPSQSKIKDQKSEILLPFPLYCTFHMVGMIGQAMILIPLARLDVIQGTTVVLAGALVALTIIRFAHRLPAWLDMTVAMVSLGGLGMNFGSWLDLHFDPAVQNGTVMACCMARKAVESTSLQSPSHWMYWLMLLAGVPAMFILRRSSITFDWRKWCCTGMLVLGIPAMCFGMWVGAQMAMHLPMYASSGMVLMSYGLMMLGMCAGMLIPHAMGLVFTGWYTELGEVNYGDS